MRINEAKRWTARLGCSDDHEEDIRRQLSWWEAIINMSWEDVITCGCVTEDSHLVNKLQSHVINIQNIQHLDHLILFQSQTKFFWCLEKYFTHFCKEHSVVVQLRAVLDTWHLTERSKQDDNHSHLQYVVKICKKEIHIWDLQQNFNSCKNKKRPQCWECNKFLLLSGHVF